MGLFFAVIILVFLSLVPFCHTATSTMGLRPFGQRNCCSFCYQECIWTERSLQWLVAFSLLILFQVPENHMALFHWKIRPVIQSPRPKLLSKNNTWRLGPYIAACDIASWYNPMASIPINCFCFTLKWTQDSQRTSSWDNILQHNYFSHSKIQKENIVMVNTTSIREIVQFLGLRYGYSCCCYFLLIHCLPNTNTCNPVSLKPVEGIKLPVYQSLSGDIFAMDS